MDLAPDFNEFCGLLRARNVEFMIVGAHALAFHGHPRFTGDLDILIRPSLANAERLLSAIADFGFSNVPLTAAQVIEPRRLIEMGVAPVQIHVMSDISGVSWDEAWATREVGRLGNEDVAFIGRDALLRNKRAAGRPQDLADLEALREPE